MPDRRRLARSIVAIALLLLGGAAASWIPITQASGRPAAEIVVSASQPYQDPSTTAAPLVTSLLAVVRGIERIASKSVDVGPGRARVRLLLDLGSSPAQALNALHAAAAAREDLNLRINSTAPLALRAFAIYALPARSDASEIARRLRAIPGVESVEIEGLGGEVPAIRPRVGPPHAAALQRAIVTAIRTRVPLDHLQIPFDGRLVPLTSVADVTTAPATQSIAAVDGHRAFIWIIRRDATLPLGKLLVADSDVARELPAGSKPLVREASIFRRSLAVGMIVFLLAATLAVLVRRSFGVLPLAIAFVATAVAPHLVALSLSTETFGSIWLSFATTLFLTVAGGGLPRGRRAALYGVAIVTMAAPALAVSWFASLYAPTMRLLGGAWIIAAALDVLFRARVASSAAPVIRFVLRGSGSVALTFVGLAAVILSFTASELDPTSLTLWTGERWLLEVPVLLPAGTTHQQTADFLGHIESRVRQAGGRVAWEWYAAGVGTLFIDARSVPQRYADRAGFLDALEESVSWAGSALVLPSSPTGRMDEMAASRSPQATVDDDARRYTVVVRAGSVAEAEDAIEGLRTIAAANRAEVLPGWGPPTVFMTVRHRPAPFTTQQEDARALLEWIKPYDVVKDPRSGRDIIFQNGMRGTDPPLAQWSQLRSAVIPTGDGSIAPGVVFEWQPEISRSSIPWDRGRLAVPVGFTIPGARVVERRGTIARIDAAIRAIRSAATIERPPLVPRSHALPFLRTTSILLLPIVVAALAGLAFLGVRPAVPVVAAALVLAIATIVFPASQRSTQFLTALAASLAVAGTAAVAASAVARGGGVLGLRRAGGHFAAMGIAAALAGGVLVAMALLLPPDEGTPPLVAGVSLLACGAVTGLGTPAMLALRRRVRPRTETAVVSDTPLVLEVRSVSKSYGSFRALRRIDFALHPGITAILGPNGAGKSTLMRILSGAAATSRGRVAISGIPLRPESADAYRGRVGYLPQDFDVYPGLTAAQFLDYWLIERGVVSVTEREASIGRLLEMICLSADANRVLRDFSGGMRRRIGLARALIGEPDVLIVDEPTAGLDVESRAMVRKLLSEVAKERIVLLSTHIASDVEQIATRLLVIFRGVLHYDGSVAGFVDLAYGSVRALSVSSDELPHLHTAGRITQRLQSEDGIAVRLVVVDPTFTAGTVVQPTLEEAFVAALHRAEGGTASRRPTGRFTFLREPL